MHVVSVISWCFLNNITFYCKILRLGEMSFPYPPPRSIVERSAVYKINNGVYSPTRPLPLPATTLALQGISNFF